MTRRKQGARPGARVVGWTLAVAVALGAVPAQASLTISEAIERAAEHDPQWAAAYTQMLAEREQGAQDRATLMPSVTLRGSGGYTAADSEFVFGSEKDSYPTWGASIEARQPILRMDWSARRDRAAFSDDRALEKLQQAQIEFIARVAQRYLQALQAQDQLALTRAESATLEQSLDDVRKRYEVELVPGTDLKEAQAQFDLSRAQVIQAEAQLEHSFDALAELTGAFAAPLPHLKNQIVLPPLPATSVDDWIALQKTRSPVLKMAEYDVAVAQTQVKARKAEALPVADLVATATNNDAHRSAMGAKQREARIGVELSVPLYAGGGNQSRVRQALAQAQSAEFEQQRLILQMERDLRGEFRDYQAAQISVQALEMGLDSARAAQKATHAGYDAGTRTIIDVLDAKRRVAQAERDLNQMRYQLLTHLLLLQAGAGTLDHAMIPVLEAMFEAP
ncbi:TolC family outer membrane protein [Sinimarinibacterium sp. NLF-5-8]|uniref:TolC family outer membrane protein n=1 Tax=Sinimarinibacterium sp. NLF-5-8 TaxID=2698684 RepID=UPI00137C2CE7|nr:TolC family outer membrane protein [Sinimarinibacterium sp. NLF-5-8]QHS09191.1 TolC family outer membrane protein [Sinimarinibacterium sp. NLF-5-8]